MSYQFVDSVGIHATASIIKQSGLQKLSIQKYGAAKHSLPVYEDVNSKTNDRIVKSFTDWASTILQGNPFNDTVYEALLFNEVENFDEEETEGAPVKRGYSKRNKMKFCFQLFRAGQGDTKSEVSGQNMSSEATIQALYQKLKDDEVLKRLEALEKRLDEYEETEEEEQTGAISDQNIATIEKFIGLLSQKNTNTQVNGIEERDKNEVTANINKAVKILWQYDKNLDRHLLKLANMAENNNALFNQVISQLDLM
jgi:hypothetical protein